MTARLPYTRDTLALIRRAEREGQTIQQCAPRLGWTDNELLQICQRNAIAMPWVPGSAAKPAQDAEAAE